MISIYYQFLSSRSHIDDIRARVCVKMMTHSPQDPPVSLRISGIVGKRLKTSFKDCPPLLQPGRIQSVKGQERRAIALIFYSFAHIILLLLGRLNIYILLCLKTSIPGSKLWRNIFRLRVTLWLKNAYHPTFFPHHQTSTIWVSCDCFWNEYFHSSKGFWSCVCQASLTFTWKSVAPGHKPTKNQTMACSSRLYPNVRCRHLQ